MCYSILERAPKSLSDDNPKFPQVRQTNSNSISTVCVPSHIIAYNRDALLRL